MASLDQVSEGSPVSINISSIAKIQGKVKALQGNTWQIDIVNFSGQQQDLDKYLAKISFATQTELLNGETRLISFDLAGKRCMIDSPRIKEQRRIRQYKRFTINCPASMVLLDPVDKSHNYRQRFHCRTRDISLGGACVAFYEEIPAEIKRGLLIISTDLEDPFNESKQIYMSCDLVRKLESEACELPDYPHAYGFEYNHILPMFEYRLSKLLAGTEQ